MAFATIDKGASYFNPVLYTGTGATQSITGVNFKPDWVWIKNRSSTIDHNLFDAVRGTGKQLQTNTTGAEFTTADALSAFGSDGFTITGTGNNYTNVNTYTYVAWNWLGANSTTSNTQGSITTTVSANTTSGFSIVSYTGTGSNATVGHGLGVAPKMIITKPRNSVDNWISWHTALGSTGYIYLNLTNASATGATVWNSTLPTSSVFSIGTSSNINTNGQTQIAYCFAEVKGFSKFGSYTGNGSADGTFVYTGFKPALVLQKTTSTTSDWNIVDNKRSTYNVNNLRLNPNTSSVESTSPDYCDLLSNGFKFRASSSGINGSGETNIYAAFAENPFVLTDGTPVTAR